VIRRIHVPALLLALAACSTDRPAQTPSTAPATALRDSAAPTPPPAPPPAPHPAPATDGEPHAIPDSVAAAEPPVAPLPPAPAYLVWTADSAHAAVTAWIDGSGRVIARRRGVFVADGARLWRWTQGRGRVLGLDCDCYHREEDRGSGKDCRYGDVMESASLVEVGGLGRIPVMQLPDSASAYGVDPGKQHAYPTAGAGPYLFNEWTFEGDGCGAHGWWGTMHQLSSVRQDSVLRTDTVRYTVADSTDGMNRLVETDWGDPEGVRGMTMGGIEGWFEADSALTVYLRFGTQAPFAFSDEGGTYGGRSETVRAHRPPRWLAPYIATPPAVRHFWQRSPRRGHAGWSAVDARHTAALLPRFRGG
jgi:hypothetical protein